MYVEMRTKRPVRVETKGRSAACRGATEPVPCSARSADDGICSDVISFEAHAALQTEVEQHDSD
ncbi:hypothetical protein XavaCFBP5823_20940 [Xanthomonas axonopodis pv. vasculorum]|nr:hypothetical protein XavaCFBP5823_20940 [Xanthomonas axonopodis pv. vasculorum]